MNLAKILAQTADRDPRKIAIDFEGSLYTYAQLDVGIKKCAYFLEKLGITKGDRVAIQIPKCVEFVYLHLAVLSIGTITLPLNVDYPASEVHYFLTDSKSSLFISYSNGYSAIREAVEKIEDLRVVMLDARSPHGFETLTE